ncbi:hypothetical protein HNR73_007684, partial [Phytomonospora endophytica]|nr:hypothetical protein [Phytomonospora endophytica]
SNRPFQGHMKNLGLSRERAPLTAPEPSCRPINGRSDGDTGRRLGVCRAARDPGVCSRRSRSCGGYGFPANAGTHREINTTPTRTRPSPREAGKAGVLAAGEVAVVSVGDTAHGERRHGERRHSEHTPSEHRPSESEPRERGFGGRVPPATPNLPPNLPPTPEHRHSVGNQSLTPSSRTKTRNSAPFPPRNTVHAISHPRNTPGHPRVNTPLPRSPTVNSSDLSTQVPRSGAFPSG